MTPDFPPLAGWPIQTHLVYEPTTQPSKQKPYRRKTRHPRKKQR